MIKVVRGDVIEGEVFYLVLTSVRYFSGPMIWSGHAFRFGTQEEIARILGKLPGDLESSADKPEHDNPLLLVFEGASQILCHHVTAFDEFPGE
jgi:hypothetical protein